MTKESKIFELIILDQFQLRDQHVVVIKPVDDDSLRLNWDGQRRVQVEVNGVVRQMEGKFLLERVNTTVGQRETIYAIAFPDLPEDKKITGAKLQVEGEN